MKKKGLTYGLLIVVAIIWGKIIYDVVGYSGEKDSPFISETVVSVEEGQLEEEYDYEPILDYRDPFLGKVKNSRSDGQRSVSKPKPKPKTEPVVAVTWPNINYLGQVRNKANGIAMAIILVDGHELVVPEGETMMQLKVEKVHQDSVLLAFAGELKNFEK